MKFFFLAVLTAFTVACGGSGTGFTSPEEVVSTPPTTDSGAPAPKVDSGATSEDDAAVSEEDAGTDSAVEDVSDAGDVAACQAAACQAASEQTHPAYGGQACGVLPVTTLCGGLPVNCGDTCDATFTCGDDGTTPNQCGNVCADIYQQDCSQHNSQFPENGVPVTHGFNGSCAATPWVGLTCLSITTPAGATRFCCD
jgi:hypothetical protein